MSVDLVSMVVPALTHIGAVVVDVVGVLPAFDVPDSEPVAPPGSGGFLAMIGVSKWIGFAIAIIGIVAVGVMFFINSRRGEAAEDTKSLMGAIVGVIIVASAAAIVQFFVNAAG